MATVIPFKGLRYNEEKINDLSKVVAPPYDIISPKYQDELYEMDDKNVIRLEYGKECEGDNEQNNKYTRAGQTLKNWINDEVLKLDKKPSFYIYEQVFSLQEGVLKSFRGIISLVELAEFSKGIVLPHEMTLSKAKSDRFNLMSSTDANFSQIYSLYLDEAGDIKNIIQTQTDRSADVSFTTTDGILQNLWIIDDKAILNEISGLFSEKQIFIADGHHRYETALNYRNKKREDNLGFTGKEPYNYVMMMLVDMDEEGLVVFPTHRLIKDLDNYDEVNIVGRLTDNFNVSKIYFTDYEYTDVINERMSKALDDKIFALYTGMNYYYVLELKNLSVMDELLPDTSIAYRHLDVTILHKLIFEQILGISEDSLKEQTNLTYTRDINEAVSEVRNKKYQCSFIINATKVHEIKEVSLANEKMPQKSTYFWPKLVTGIVMNKF